MAPVRRSTDALAIEVRETLNRPDDDDFFAWPNRYYEALSRAHRRVYGKIGQHAPELISSQKLVTTSDDGQSYDLTDHYYGDLLVWEPPGPTGGVRLYPALAESPYVGFYRDGTTIVLTQARVYTPGLYAVSAWATLADLDKDQDHVLPSYCEDMMILEAAAYLADTPGFLGSPDGYRKRAIWEWKGNPEDPSDMGILGTIKRLSANEGIEAGEFAERPWWRGIGR